MAGVRPGWMVALCAAGLSVSSWLPWLRVAGGRASAIGGTFGDIAAPARFGVGQLIVLLSSVLIVLGAMAARGLAQRLVAAVAVAVSVLVTILTWWFFHAHVVAPVAAGYGLYLGAACVLGVLGCSTWALVSALRSERPVDALDRATDTRR